MRFVFIYIYSFNWSVWTFMLTLTDLHFSGVLEGAGATTVAGRAAQGSNAQDHVPAAMV